jgi:hypothetical protein
MKCWYCRIEDSSNKKIGFRASCDNCGSWLHCCRNCKNYKPGLPNDCTIPGTEYIADREKNNFCEEFQLLTLQNSKESLNLRDIEKRLFNDD